jgi:hypothetical protein
LCEHAKRKKREPDESANGASRTTWIHIISVDGVHPDP